MEAAIIKRNFDSGLSLKEAMAMFFKENTPDKTNVLLWKFFQCWVTKDCNIKAEISDEEVALFFDQLMGLITAAYDEHVSAQQSAIIESLGDESAGQDLITVQKKNDLADFGLPASEKPNESGISPTDKLYSLKPKNPT